MRTHRLHGGFVWVLVALVVVFAAVLSAGCGPSKKTIQQTGTTATETTVTTSTAEVTSTSIWHGRV